MMLAGQLTQLFAAVVEGVVRSNGLGNGNVIGGLGFVHIGNRNQTHLKTLFGLLQLTGTGLFFRLGKFHPVLRREHRKVGH